MAAVAPSPRPTAPASKHRAPRRWSGSQASLLDGSARRSPSVGERVRCIGHYVALLRRNSLGGTASRGSHWALYSEEATMRKELISTVAAGCLIGMTGLPALAASAF